MDMRIHFTALPSGMDLDGLRRGLDQILEDDGWLIGSNQGPDGGWIDLELEDERVNPKYGILAVKHYLQQVGFACDTAMELAGLTVGIFE